MIKTVAVSVFLVLVTITTMNANRVHVEPCDRICGKWQSEKKNCIVQIFHEGEDFGAKLVWFDDSDDPTHPMETREDVKNPDVKLRNRKIVGINVLEDLKYSPKTNSWEDGKIYDAQTGKKWSSAAVITPDGSTLKVTGYWHFKFIGRTMAFHRVL